MDRARKEEIVAELNGMLTAAEIVVVTHYSGLNVAEITDLRRQMREAGARFVVTKNRLVHRAIDGTPRDAIVDLFEGPTAIACSDDPIAAPRVAVKFSETNENLVILGGMMGETVLDDSEVKALAKLPSLDELRATLIGLISAPATKIAGVLQAPAGQMARVLGAYAATEEVA